MKGVMLIIADEEHIAEHVFVIGESSDSPRRALLRPAIMRYALNKKKRNEPIWL